MKQLRSELLPSLKQDFLQQHTTTTTTTTPTTTNTSTTMTNANINTTDNNTQLITIIICGTNDWKKVFESFPYGAGLLSYKHELQLLIKELREIMPGQVYLPAVPISCG